MTKQEYKVETKFDEKENGYVSWIPALNNIAAFGETKEESLKNLKKVKRDYLKFLAANKKPIPNSDL